MMEHGDSGASPDAGAERPKVLYVMGAGRSGSTILGVALGNCDGVFFAGELNRWLPLGGVPPRQDEPRRRFWQAVQRAVGGEELYGGRTTFLERSSAILDPRKWPSRRRLRAPYRAASERLYRAIQRETGCDYIVDTSHYPLRAHELQSLEGIDLYLLYLVRDARSVVASMGREDVAERRFDMPTANLYLWLTNLFAVPVFLRHPRGRRLLVRHEDFLADPDRVLSRILEQVGSSAGPPPSPALRTGVPFHGNRLLGSQEVVLEPRPRERIRGSHATAALQLPWRLVFSLLGPVAEATGPWRTETRRYTPAP